MNTILSASTIANGDRMQSATQNDELLSAFASISHGITRPYSVRRPIDDAAQGRKVLPLGVYPRVSEEVARRGGSWYYVTRPLFVQLARLRQIFGAKTPTIQEALCVAKKEEAEADVSELNLALSCSNPDTSVLASYVKETREEIEAEERAVEIAEGLLYARGVK